MALITFPFKIDRRGKTPKPNFDGTIMTAYPNGDKPEPSAGLTVLKTENFSTGTFAEKPWIVHNRGNFDYSAIRDYGAGERSIRHLLNTAYATDPVTGQLTDGLYTHTFIASDFYDPSIQNNVTFEQYFTLADSFWGADSGALYPLAAGKIFLEDTDFGPNGPYLGLTNNNDTVALVSENGPSDFDGWRDRSYGWKNGDGTGRNIMYLSTAGFPLFHTDGVERRLTFEIRYNPNGIGYHKGRIRSDSQICHDSDGLNTDAEGWFNLPIEYVLKGTRIIAAAHDLQNYVDTSTDPATYNGYAGAYEVSEYTIYEGLL